MLYSTGSTHLLSAILTRRSGRSTLDLAREWLGPLEEFSIAAWERDPQGIHLGGNQMAMSPRSLAAFGHAGRQRQRHGRLARVRRPKVLQPQLDGRERQAHRLGRLRIGKGQGALVQTQILYRE